MSCWGCRSSSGPTCITRLSLLNMKPPAFTAGAYLCALVPCVKRSICALFINSFCCYGSAFCEVSIILWQSQAPLPHHSPNRPHPTHTHTHVEIHKQPPWPNSRWHNTALSQNNSTKTMKYEGAVEKDIPRCSGVKQSQAACGELWSFVLLQPVFPNSS